MTVEQPIALNASDAIATPKAAERALIRNDILSFLLVAAGPIGIAGPIVSGASRGNDRHLEEGL